MIQWWPFHTFKTTLGLLCVFDLVTGCQFPVSIPVHAKFIKCGKKSLIGMSSSMQYLWWLMFLVIFTASFLLTFKSSFSLAQKIGGWEPCIGLIKELSLLKLCCLLWLFSARFKKSDSKNQYCQASFWNYWDCDVVWLNETSLDCNRKKTVD